MLCLLTCVAYRSIAFNHKNSTSLAIINKIDLCHSHIHNKSIYSIFWRFLRASQQQIRMEERKKTNMVRMYDESNCDRCKWLKIFFSNLNKTTIQEWKHQNKYIPYIVEFKSNGYTGILFIFLLFVKSICVDIVRLLRISPYSYTSITKENVSHI